MLQTIKRGEMPSQVGNERGAMKDARWITIDRPDSSQLVDLHVYIIPNETWKTGQNLAGNQAIEQAISAGFVHIPEALTIHDLRRYILEICGDDPDFPKKFIYLRSVGRCLTKVKTQQEKELKVKHFRPPTIFAAEIYILDEELHDEDNEDHISTTEYEKDEVSPESPSWTKPTEGSPSVHISSNPRAKVSPRNLSKLREEQDRLASRQLELARKREETEKEEEEQQQAALKIQTAYRAHREQHKQPEAEHEAQEEEHTSISEEDEQTPAIARLSTRLEELRIKRNQLEIHREFVVRQIQYLHTQLTIRRREEKELWKQKYLLEKSSGEMSKEHPGCSSKNSNDIPSELEQAKRRLKKATRRRREAEYETHLLRQDLQQISSTINTLERHRLPKETELLA